MKSAENEEKLASALQANKRIALRDYTVSLDPAGIIIDRDGHVKGIWQFVDDAFEWTPAAYNEATITARSVEEALKVTLAELDIH